MAAPNIETRSLKKYYGDLNPDGIDVGQTPDDQIGFYGTTPVAQFSGASTARMTTVVASVGGTGFQSVAQANLLIQAVQGMQEALIKCGIMKGTN
jgi:hypothetical protein